MTYDGHAQGDGFVEQIVYEHKPGYGITPVRFTMSDTDLDRYDRGLNLARYVAASPELPNGGNLYYQRYGPDDRWAVLVYRELDTRQRFTSRAHVLIASSNVLTPDAAVAMWDWPFPMGVEDGELPALTHLALQSKVDEIRGSWQDTATPAAHRLLVELVCHDEELAVKADPSLRKDLLVAVAQQAPASLCRGFSVHETKYDEMQSLPRLCFISKEQEKSGFETRRRVIDLDGADAGQGLPPRVAVSLANAYRGGGSGSVAALLDQRLSDHEETMRELLTRWEIPTVPPLLPSDSDDTGIAVGTETTEPETTTPKTTEPWQPPPETTPPDEDGGYETPPFFDQLSTDVKVGQRASVDSADDAKAPSDGLPGTEQDAPPSQQPVASPAETPVQTRSARPLTQGTGPEHTVPVDSRRFLVTYVWTMAALMALAVLILFLSSPR